MSLKDHIEDTGVRGSDHAGSHTQTYVVKDAPEASEGNPEQDSDDPRSLRSTDYARHSHAGTTGTGSGQISPQTHNSDNRTESNSGNSASGSTTDPKGPGDQSR